MRKMISSLARCLALAGVMVLAQQASAQGINIDIEGSATGGIPGTGLPANTFGAAANQPGQWNRVFNAPNPIGLNGLDGLASGVTMTRSNVATHTGFDNANTSGDHQFLLDDYQAINGAINITFSGLDPGWYEVYTYSIDPSNAAARTRVTIAAAYPPTVQQAGGAMPANAFLLGRTHTKHRVEVLANGNMFMTVAGFGSGGTLSGLQLKPVDPCPMADITDPANFECVCEQTDVKGNVTIAAPGTVAFWYLEYREINDPDWTFIGFGFTAGVNQFLGTFNTAGLSQGYYFLRLTAVGGDGCQHEDTHIVWVDKQFDALDMTAPVTGQAYGGQVCVGGIVDDHCLRNYTIQWAPLPAGFPFTDINPGTPNYFGHFPIVGTWATWDTIGQMIPDGDYRIRVDALDTCGHEAFDTADIIVDNTAPDAEITSPVNCETVLCGSTVTIKGTACDANIAGWTLQVTGGPYNGWVTIASGNTCIVDDTIATWNTLGLPNCCYTLRLIVTDSAILDCNGAIAHQTEFTTSINLGLRGDVTGDGQVNFADITEVLTFWGFVCP